MGCIHDNLVIYHTVNEVVCADCGFRWMPEQTTDDLLDLMLRLEPNSPGRKQVESMLKQLRREHEEAIAASHREGEGRE